MLTFGLLMIGFVSIYFLFKKRNRRNLPPGPTRLPIVGSLPFLTLRRGIMDWTMDQSVIENRLSTVGIGPKIYFVLNDFELAKDLLARDEFSGRVFNDFYRTHKYIDGIPHGIIGTEGSHWLRQRRFGLKTLKEFGFGKKGLEETMYLEIDETVNHFLDSKSKDFCLGTDFNMPVINILWQLVAGHRFTKDGLQGQKMLSSMNSLFKGMMRMFFTPLPILKLFPKLTTYEEQAEIWRILRNFILNQIEVHEETLDEGNPRDYIDVYLTELRKNEETNEFRKIDLVVSMLDFLLAGTETTSTTLKWMILFLTVHQDVQNKY